MNKLVEHARRELKILGEDKNLSENILKIVSTFSEFGHSGASAEITIEYLQKLLRFENISPLTDDPNEWEKIPQEQELGAPTWQNIRNGKAFSHDAGQTYYLLGEVTMTGPNAFPTHKTLPHHRLKGNNET